MERNRELNEAELNEWTHFHLGLLTDPRFHETAADRFKRAGFPKLSTPAAVAEMVRDDLTTEEAAPGEMELHLKGQGSDHTQRALETLTAAVTSHANALQQQRIDGGVTVVSLAAASGNEPLDNTLMLYFVGILLVGMTVCIVFLVAMWKRLAGAKTAFERDDIVNQALDNNKWAAFTAAAAAQQGTAAVAVAAATKGKKKSRRVIPAGLLAAMEQAAPAPGLLHELAFLGHHLPAHGDDSGAALDLPALEGAVVGGHRVGLG